MTDATVSETIVGALRGVIDPCCRERGISVVDMGLIDQVVVGEDGRAHVDIVLTSGWCPFQVDLLEEIGAAVRSVPQVRDAEVSITLDTAWSPARMDAAARDSLRLLPEPSEVRDRDAFLAKVLPVLPPPIPAVASAAAATNGARDDR